MNLMIVVKRAFSALFIVAAFALCTVGATTNEPCPLPISSESTTTAASDPTQSPEQGDCMKAVMHNGMIICLPCPAYDAHRQHGDADAGPCTKPGKV